MIGIGVILGAEPPGPGERRFIQAIADDPRFDLRMLAAARDPASTHSVAVDRTLQLESRLFPAPDAVPPDIPKPVQLADASPAACDVVVDFSHSDPALSLAASTPEGVWRLSAFSPGAGRAEARDRAPVTGVTLSRCREGQAPQPIATARYDTKFLATRNAAFIREKSVQILIQALARLATTGSADRVAEALPAPRDFGAGDLPGYVLRTAGKLAVRAFNAASERVGRRPGMFELRLGHGDRLSFDPAAALTLTPPAGTYWADPFLFEHHQALYLFYEVYDYATRLGYLAVGRVDGDRLVSLGTALKQPYHLSYPFVFAGNGDVWMIPETHAAKRLEVWRATDFPTSWERAATAFEGVNLADSVLFEQDGQWWLFTNICHDSFGDHGTELHLFRVDGPLLNEIEPHPLNPVVIDSTTARGGGRVFEQGGKLYRTSQDNSHGIYGFGLNLMEITRLDPRGYEERRVRHVVPDFEAGLMGCHHMDAAAGRFVFDVRRRALGVPKMRA